MTSPQGLLYTPCSPIFSNPPTKKKKRNEKKKPSSAVWKFLWRAARQRGEIFWTENFGRWYECQLEKYFLTICDSLSVYSILLSQYLKVKRKKKAFKVTNRNNFRWTLSDRVRFKSVMNWCYFSNNSTSLNIGALEKKKKLFPLKSKFPIMKRAK